MDEHELAWAAGFFDGDGWAASVGDRRRTRGQPHAQINQAGPDGVPEVLMRFRDAVGAGRVAGPKIEEGRKDLYWWVASSGGDVRRTGYLIGPWLSDQKRVQFHAAVGLAFGAPPVDCSAWAAGLFDAEGSTSLGDHRSHAGYKYVEASITQSSDRTTPQELVRFRRVVGQGQIYGPYGRDGTNQPAYRWRVQQADEVRRVVHLLVPWLGRVKRTQAFGAFNVVDTQPSLFRGRVDWGSHKTHCVHGHEYATARIRPYASRGLGVPRRPSKQCLTCTREQARVRTQARSTIGGPSAADHDVCDDGAIC